LDEQFELLKRPLRARQLLDLGEGIDRESHLLGAASAYMQRRTRPLCTVSGDAFLAT
jgi:hypothetical protein